MSRKLSSFAKAAGTGKVDGEKLELDPGFRVSPSDHAQMLTPSSRHRRPAGHLLSASWCSTTLRMCVPSSSHRASRRSQGSQRSSSASSCLSSVSSASSTSSSEAAAGAAAAAAAATPSGPPQARASDGRAPSRLNAPPSPVAAVQAAPAAHFSPAARALARGAPAGLSPAAVALTLSQTAGRGAACPQACGRSLLLEASPERRRAHPAPAEYPSCSSDREHSGHEGTQVCRPFSSSGHPRKRYRAVLIGIGYRDDDVLDHLVGAVTDVQEMYALVTNYIGFKAEDVRVLADEPIASPAAVTIESPTKANIFSAMTWLVDGAGAGDSCFFFFAGHGHHMPDVNGDEISGMDQVLFPVDLKSAGCILDDRIYERLVRGVPPGVRLTAVVDACRSGTVLDLPFLYQYPEVLAEARDMWSAERQKYAAGGRGLGSNSAFGSTSDQAGKCTRALMTTEGDVPRYRKRAGHGVGEVVLFSGAADSQNATDAPIDGTEAVSMGIFTRTFISELKDMLTGDEPQTYGAFLDKVKKSVVARVGELWNGQASQVPQMSSSYPFDIYKTNLAI